MIRYSTIAWTGKLSIFQLYSLAQEQKKTINKKRECTLSPSPNFATAVGIEPQVYGENNLFLLFLRPGKTAGPT